MAAGSHHVDSARLGFSWAVWLPGAHLITAGVFSGLPLSYYRLVAWPWVVLWQVGWLLLLGWGMARLRQRHHPFYRLGHGLDGWLAALGLTLILSGGFSAFPRVAVWNISLAISYGLGLYTYRNWVDQNGLPRQRLWLGLVALATGVATISLALWRPDSALWQAQNVLTALRNHQPWATTTLWEDISPSCCPWP
ncbi:MAG: hypothetical protein HC929_19420 [Leptolyngbyaceae cyanobacterium SM2_5_2]|nr:hypothetical protein [Leptolyngbyaceae cyanobacterium SM2_5_2]